MIKKTKRIHQIWKEYEAMPEEFKKDKKIHQLTGKWQYIYETEKGEISLVELFGHVFSNFSDWTTPMFEIYSLKGDLFEDCERFPKFEEAEKTIEQILGDKIEH